MRFVWILPLLPLLAFAQQEPEGRAVFVDAAQKYHDGAYDACIEGFRRTVSLHHEVPFSKMMIARCFALKGDVENGITALDEAAEFEFLGTQVLLNEPEFANLRQDPRYADIVAKVRINNSRPCPARKNRRAFDFLIGEWAVTNARDQAVGTDLIESVDDGCALRETLTGPNGNTIGRSISYYERLTGWWRQVWTDSSGISQDMYGEVVDGSLKFSQATFAGGLKTLTAITYTSAEDGTIRQITQRSTDGGANWTTASSLTLRRRQPQQ